MLKKIYTIIFIILFMSIISLPLITANWTSGEISVEENRYLAKKPNLLIKGKFNDNFTEEVDTWFMDHMGYREEFIYYNAKLQYKVFDKLPTVSDYYIGRNGDLIYAREDMILDYAHQNLRTEEEIAKIGNSYQTISDWFEEKGIQFYYVQCWDKHSIYPEQYMDSINQYGDISKTDQIISYLRENTSVKVFSLKETLLDNKNRYRVFSNWGDPMHWTDRGAYIGYKYIMQGINKYNNNSYKILEEEDYIIYEADGSKKLNGYIYNKDTIEIFQIKKPNASEANKAILGRFSNDRRHSVWTNPEVNNDTKLLLVCDSYFRYYILDDFAESFSEVWLIWGDYTGYIEEMVDMYNPDIVIYECAEFVDRSMPVVNLAEELRK